MTDQPGGGHTPQPSPIDDLHEAIAALMQDRYNRNHMVTSSITIIKAVDLTPGMGHRYKYLFVAGDDKDPDNLLGMTHRYINHLRQADDPHNS